jgi:hypothetical protein
LVQVEQVGLVADYKPMAHKATIQFSAALHLQAAVKVLAKITMDILVVQDQAAAVLVA